MAPLSPDSAEEFAHDRVQLGTLKWSFGVPTRAVGPEAGRVFAVEGMELVVRFSEASQAVALDLGEEREVIVMCKR